MATCCLAARFLLLTAALLLTAVTLANSNTCNVGWSATCNPSEFTATSNVFFHVNRTSSNADEETFNATVAFHWGIENLTIPSQPYKISGALPAPPDVVALSNKFKYDAEGYYRAGYSISFDDNNAAGCSMRTLGSTQVLKMERTPLACAWGAETPAPTTKPTVSASPMASTGAGVTNPPPAGTLGDGGDGNGGSGEDGDDGNDASDSGAGSAVCQFGLSAVAYVFGTFVL